MAPTHPRPVPATGCGSKRPAPGLPPDQESTGDGALAGYLCERLEQAEPLAPYAILTVCAPGGRAPPWGLRKRHERLSFRKINVGFWLGAG